MAIRTLTKAELIARVHSRKALSRDLTKKAVARIIDAVFTEMGDYFIRVRVSRRSAPKFSYPGFGTFAKRQRNPRVGRNPRTGAPIVIPAQTTVTFAPGQELRGLLNQHATRRTQAG